jgi:hypothetical protein
MSKKEIYMQSMINNVRCMLAPEEPVTAQTIIDLYAMLEELYVSWEWETKIEVKTEPPCMED